MNPARRGYRLELKAKKLLEVDHAVHRPTKPASYRNGVGFRQSVDVFGCIDLIAKSRTSTSPEQRTRWIQVTSTRDLGRKLRKIRTIPWNPTHDSVEIWRWVGGGKHVDGRTGQPRARNYFKVYTLDNGFSTKAASSQPTRR